MAMMKHLCETLGEFDIFELNKMAARRVADELGYSQTCKNEIDAAGSSEEVDEAMRNERRRKNENRNGTSRI